MGIVCVCGSCQCDAIAAFSGSRGDASLVCLSAFERWKLVKNQGGPLSIKRGVTSATLDGPGKWRVLQEKWQLLWSYSKGELAIN